MVQPREARFVENDYSRYSHITPMIHKLGWDTLESRRFQLHQLCSIKLIKAWQDSVFHQRSLLYTEDILQDCQMNFLTTIYKLISIHISTLFTQELLLLGIMSQLLATNDISSLAVFKEKAIASIRFQLLVLTNIYVVFVLGFFLTYYLFHLL